MYDTLEAVSPCEFRAKKEASEIKIDWPSMIDRLEELLPNHGDEYLRLHDLAYGASGQWVTCACGNLCWRIPRQADGEPIDSILAEHGFNFAEFIGRENYPQARKALAAIELRSMEILHIMKHG